MPLSDLISGIAPTASPADRPMSLPQAMRALERGEIQRPVDHGELGNLLMPTSQDLPRPKPPPDPIADIIEEQRQHEAECRHEMLIRVRARQLASPGNKRMELAERQLREMENSNG